MVPRTVRAGLRIRGGRGNPVVRHALIRFARWLRSGHAFPVRVPVYLSAKRRLITVHSGVVTASFFGPDDRREEPYIRIATGDYPELRASRGRDNALASFVTSLAHEVVHYEQWLDSKRFSERDAVRSALSILRRYERTVDHP